MQSIIQFMQGYFEDRTAANNTSCQSSDPFRKKYYTSEYLDDYRKSYDNALAFELKEPAKVLSVTEAAQASVVTTLEPMLDRQVPFRYHLVPCDGTWRISRREWQCFLCKGTGKRRKMTCDRCGGTGWRHYGSSDA